MTAIKKQTASASVFADDAKRMLAPLEEELIELLQALVQTNSTAIPPNGCETEAQKVLLSFLERHGVDAELYELAFLHDSDHPYVRTERNYSGRHNLIARLNGSGNGRSLLLSGHMDTVPAGRGQWNDDPWSGAIKNGQLYGRGSYDMKGGLVAAFAVIVAIKESGISLNGDLLCESVIDEEWGGGGGTLAGRMRGDIADGCIIPEPTDLAIFRASRGGSLVDIHVTAGDPDSYFSKDEVVSPAIPMGRLLGWVDEWRSQRKQIDRRHAYSSFSDPAPVQVLAVQANSFDSDIPWSVPLTGRLRLYFQFLPHEDVAEVIEEIHTSFQSFCRNDPFFTTYVPEWKSLFDPPLLGHELAADHDLTLTLSRNLGSVSGAEAVVTAAEYPCDAFLNQLYFGMPTLIFGPRGAGPHNANEYVELNSVMQTAEALLATTMDWCGSSN